MQLFLASLVGGVLIGAAAAALLLVNGRVAGVSGILADATAPSRDTWRWAFLAGLVAAGVAAQAFGLASPQGLERETLWGLAGAGLLVGFGTRTGSGCTSGHGVCGLANLSVRSLAAVATFMASAGVVVFFVRHLAPVRHILAQGGLS
jgi:uncharacterized protein